MADKRPGSWQPPGKAVGRASPTASAPKATTEIFAVKRSEPKPAPPSRPAAAPVGGPDLAGPSTGRGLRDSGEPRRPAAAPLPTSRDEGLSPFQKFAPSSDQLGGAAAARSGESVQVLAIVMGLVFMVAATVVVVALLVGVTWWTVGDQIADGRLAELIPGEDHIKDTDVAEIIVKPKPRPAGGAAPKAEDPAPEPVPQAPTTGSGTIQINGDVLFHSIEVNCPTGGIRTRADFRNNAATVYGIPLKEDCTVTFQGGQPARATLRGGQTKSCTFNPTLCRLQ